jgi:primase-polymerase (primpol)-like protein
MKQLPKGLTPLAAYNQFIVWKLVQGAKKPRKVPINIDTMAAHNAHDSAVWMNVTAAITAADLLGDEYSVGFVFTKADPFWFLDIDHCLEATVMNSIAKEMTENFSGCAIEVSQSDQGLHIFGTGNCPPHGTRDKLNGMEFYTEQRFVALTGNMLNEASCATDCGILLPW